MQSYFKDEVRIALLSSQDDRQPGSTSQVDHAINTSPHLSWRSSLSSSTNFDCEEARHSDDVAGSQEGQQWFACTNLSETLVGSLIANNFPSLKKKFPGVLDRFGYKQLRSDDKSSKPKLNGSKKKAICYLLLAAILLGAGGKAIQGAIRKAYHDTPKDAFAISLHDEDSLQDASIKVPTILRPALPSSADEVLPFELHQDDNPVIATPAPSSSAPNKRQLHSIPSQQLIFDKQGCIESWVGQGIVCDALEGAYRDKSDLTSIDVLYSWVNGSDWRHSSAKWMHGYRPTGHWQEYVEEDLFPSSSSAKDDDSTNSPSPSRRSLEKPRTASDAKLTRRAGAAI